MKISDRTLIILILLALLSVITSMILILEKLGAPSFLVGLVTLDTGVVNVTISATTDINFVNDNVDFGSGTVNLGGINTSVNTSDTAWGGNENPNGFSNPGPFQVRNDGNVDVNITINSSSTASTFIGGTNPGYYAVGSFVGTDEGCLNNMTNNSTALNGITSTAFLICENLTYADAADTLNISIFLDIPSDAVTGLKTDSGFEVHANRVLENVI